MAVADRPEGPFRDVLGRPLVDRFHNGAQPIDPFVFRDDDGQHYLYYGGWRHCNVVRLTPDLRGLASFPDGVVYRDITPANYVEGPFVFKRQGRYSLMWSEGGWQGPNYSVAYAIGDSPPGPFALVGRVLQQDPAVATGAGHHSVIPIPGSDTWYIVYHPARSAPRTEITGRCASTRCTSTKSIVLLADDLQLRISLGGKAKEYVGKASWNRWRDGFTGAPPSKDRRGRQTRAL